MNTFIVVNTSSTSSENSSTETPAGFTDEERMIANAVKVFLTILVPLGMFGNVLLFKVTNFMVEKKQEQG